jgi:hypothetical protein
MIKNNKFQFPNVFGERESEKERVPEKEKLG